MKKSDIHIGGIYAAKVSGSITHVRITGESRYGGWDAINVRTQRHVYIRSAARLRYEIEPVRDALAARQRIAQHTNPPETA
jgi:hypothetical protein